EAGRRATALLALLARPAVRARDDLQQASIALGAPLAPALRGVAPALQARQQHPVRDLEARFQRLGCAADQTIKGAAIEVHVALRGRLVHHDLLALRGLRREPLVLDDVLGRLGEDVAVLVEAFAARAPRDLVEL